VGIGSLMFSVKIIDHIHHVPSCYENKLICYRIGVVGKMGIILKPLKLCKIATVCFFDDVYTEKHVQ